eukprot:TRINITY_DN15227_c0_g1_i1.p1 TRINITY_DN15227_c0_g1~~TRINITY_DN15227_c0_g1_i1.p1  ORF type:complete len:154 (+),score=36.08 TRINITY_DN15227_c0_g1_i1:232-693(+)
MNTTLGTRRPASAAAPSRPRCGMERASLRSSAPGQSTKQHGMATMAEAEFAVSKSDSDQFDTDGNGLLNADELARQCTDQEAGVSKGSMEKAMGRAYKKFNQLDVDGSGLLEGAELLSLIHISEPTRLLSISYAVFCLKKKKKTRNTAIHLSI